MVRLRLLVSPDSRLLEGLRSRISNVVAFVSGVCSLFRVALHEVDTSWQSAHV